MAETEKKIREIQQLTKEGVDCLENGDYTMARTKLDQIIEIRDELLG